MAALQPNAEGFDKTDNGATTSTPAQPAAEVEGDQEPEFRPIIVPFDPANYVEQLREIAAEEASKKGFFQESAAEYDAHSDCHEDAEEHMYQSEFDGYHDHYENFQPRVESAVDEDFECDLKYDRNSIAAYADQSELQGQNRERRQTGQFDQARHHNSAPNYVDAHDGVQESHGGNPFQGQPAGDLEALFDAIDASSQAAFQGSGHTAEQLSTDAVTSSASDLYRCSDRGLQIALKNFLSRHKTPVAKRAAKDEKYVEYIARRRQQLEGKLCIAEGIWDECKRDREVNTDPKLTGILSFKFSRADLKYQRAKRDYEMFVSELKEIAQLPLLSRDEMEVASLHRKKKYDDLKAHDIEEDLLSSKDTWKLQIGRALERSRGLETQLASTSKLLEEVKEDARDLRQIVQNLKDDKLKSEVQLTGELARRAQDFNEVSEQTYMLEETCCAQAEHIRVLEQQLDMLRFGGARTGSETVADDLKEAHDEQFGSTKEEDEISSKFLVDAPHALSDRVFEKLANDDYIESRSGMTFSDGRTSSNGELASFDCAHDTQSDSAEQLPVTPTLTSGKKDTALGSPKQQPKRCGNVDLHDPAKCQWHAQDACRILSPNSQKRTGKFCKVIEPEQK